MKTDCIQTKLINSNKAYLIKWKPIAFEQNSVNQSKANGIQT